MSAYADAGYAGAKEFLDSLPGNEDVLNRPDTVRGDDRFQRHLHGLDGDDQGKEPEQ